MSRFLPAAILSSTDEIHVKLVVMIISVLKLVRFLMVYCLLIIQ